MKLFNAQSVEKQFQSKVNAVAKNKNLDDKVLSNKDFLASIAGGINEMSKPWPPVRP